MRRIGGVPGNSARSAEIQRNRLLLGPKGRNFAPRGSMVDFVEISALNTDKSRRFADPPPGRFDAKGRDSWGNPTDRPEFSESASNSGRMVGIAHLMSLRRRAMGSFQGILKNLGWTPIRRPAGLSAEGEFQGGLARSTGIQRKRHILGTKGRNFAPRDSAADCV